MKKLLAMLALLTAVAAQPASATLQQLTSHLQATDTMTARFSQTGADGRTVNGRLYLERPGKIRFQYQKGIPLLVVANGRSLDVVDYEVDQVQRYPIGETPLSVLLDPNAELAKFAEVKSSSADALVIEARDRKHPEYGIITLFFERDGAAPGDLLLHGWNVVDSQGNNTRVVLSDVKFNVDLPKNAFRYTDPRGPRRRR
ncbi:cell envelope biogenesis protein LolA [Pacificimonas flava]|uniref:Cell envelope biogenesis protein LolA n=2 Tax=Pacificimonas TaxID=1960290 RepID=A0A219B4Q3_9SPHN|nr:MULTISPECIES: outer membrane lipoprotein carrier protein LolA [Pacificimonas]MBZ6377538.1 outer-membrane lipoprotein carrier protein LolA [Pacificimonas aurantium]OWV32769.1 cell envelope biogenesis protein LolA [Pacificimonas flava]